MEIVLSGLSFSPWAPPGWGVAAPVVSSHQKNGPSTTPSSFSIVGLNFGSLDQTASAVMGNTVCRTVSWTTVTLLQCARSRADRFLVVTVDTNAVGTVNIGFTYDGPQFLMRACCPTWLFVMVW